MSDRMQPGSMASLALQHDIAFQVSFPDGDMPSQPDLYWRGLVLWRGDGLTWVRVDNLHLDHGSPVKRDRSAQPKVRQRIVLQPHGGRWMFALDRPAHAIQHGSLQPGGFLQSYRPVIYPISYEIISRLDNREISLPSEKRELALQVPPNVSPRVRALAESWRALASSDREIVAKAISFFRDSGFAYSLTPGVYEQNELEAFLFDRRLGFCEHYAGAFASLMRLAGVPARVVIGYHGGQFNRHGNLVTVRQSDAHAWTEVWLKEVGWQRVDPTTVIAPERITAGFEGYLESQAAQSGDISSQTRRFAAWQNAVRDVRLLWDSIAYRWDLWVLNFDEESQRTFLLMLGLGALEWSSLAGILALGVILFIAAIGLWLRFVSRKRLEPVAEWYDRFCRRLETWGVPREPWEGAQQFTNRASMLLPEHSAGIRLAGELYVQLRYSPTPPLLSDFIAAVRALEALPESSRPQKVGSSCV